MIGVFDSGYGGLTILQACIDRLPNYSFSYLGDNARAPYGSRSEEEIIRFALQGVEFLFGQGCPLVILACNTASANALRRIQQAVLPQRYPDKRVLGILVPTVEQVSERNVTVFATEATVRSHAYAHEIAKRNPSVRVVERACPRIVPLIESGASQDMLREAVADCASGIEKPDAVILGCTHYPLVKDFFREALPGIPLYEQPQIVADRLADYLERHPEVAQMLDKRAQRQFFTTADPDAVSALASRFFGQTVSFTHALLQE
jgi:glutamate racemase